ncbi:hypothetical protein [Micromonospora sp. NPDC007230]|uniref:hypothetical protein n=1 Tax=Micromonospora sp. NPDC007230 TaxID=3364237 RepID=UPI0036A870B1
MTRKRVKRPGTGAVETCSSGAAESLVHDGAVSIGLLAGGVVIGVAGAGPTLVVVDAAQVAVGLLAGPGCSRFRIPPRFAPGRRPVLELLARWADEQLR